MQDGRKAVWSTPYVSVAFFSSLEEWYAIKFYFKVLNCIFEINQQWQSGYIPIHAVAVHLDVKS